MLYLRHDFYECKISSSFQNRIDDTIFFLSLSCGYRIGSVRDEEIVKSENKIEPFQ